MRPEERQKKLENIGADLNSELDPTGLNKGDTIAFNPPDERDPEPRQVERTDKMLTGTEVKLEGGDLLFPSDFNNDSGLPRAAPISERSGSRLQPTDIKREPDGEFTPPASKLRPAANTNAQRGPNGRFVSNNLRDLDDIGRQDNTGLFDLF